MRLPACCVLLPGLLLLGASAPPVMAQDAPQAIAQTAAVRRTSMQWTEMKGKRTQIFIDLNAKNQSTYHGINAEFAPTFMIQLPGDGSVDLLEYQGSGDDWKWTSVPAHVTLTHPSTGVDRVEFDYTPLAAGKNFTVVFRSLDDGWKVVASSKALPWRPS